MCAFFRWNYVENHKASYGPTVIFFNMPAFNKASKYYAGTNCYSVSSSLVEIA